MPGEPTYAPQPLDLPHCWVAGDTIAGIVITYDGPSLDGAAIQLIFSTGQTLTATAVAAPEDDYPDRWTITFDSFEPDAPSSGSEVEYKLPILFGVAADPLTKKTIHAGTWQLKVIS